MTVFMYNTQIAVNLLQQLMRRGNKEVYYDNWSEIKNCLTLLTTESFRCDQSDQLLKNIVGSVFGSGKHKGFIEKRISYYFKKLPIFWSQEVYQIVEMFSPKSELLRCSAGILRNKDYQIAIEFKILPKSIQNEFPTSQCRNSRILKSLKRVSNDQFVISMWEWLWIHVAYRLVNLPEIEENPSIWDEQVEDDMYYVISRNPLLLLLRKALTTEYSENKARQLMQRMRGVFQLFFIEDLISYVKQSYLYTQNSYQLRSHHFAAIFLLICSRRDNLIDDTLKTYYEYFQCVTQGYQRVTTAGRNNLRYLMRIWDFFITRKNGADYHLFNKLDKANPQAGWYKLQRCPIKLWMRSAKEPEIQTYEQRLIISTRNKIYRLLRNQDDWLPNFSFLYTLEQFVNLDKNVLSVCFRRSRKEEYDMTSRQCFYRTLTHLAEKGADQKVLQQIQKQLNDQFLQIWVDLININFVEKGHTVKTKSFMTSWRKKSQEISLNYQSSRLRSVWQHQRQENEFQNLLRASRWLANQLDKLIPGHSQREYPCINIRIFANPFIFLGFVLMIVLFFRLNLRE